MIFSEEYDRSLWLVSAGDKENRELLLYFVKTIPEELYDKIHQAISKKILDQYKNEFNYSNNFINASDGFHYYIDIDFINESLKLKINRWKYFANITNTDCYQDIEEEFELVLDKTYIHDLETPSLVEDIEKKFIGTFNYKSTKSMLSEINDIQTTNGITYNANYELITTPVGLFIRKTTNNKKKIRKIKALESYPNPIDSLDYEQQSKIYQPSKAKKLKIENKKITIIKRKKQQE